MAAGMEHTRRRRTSRFLGEGEGVQVSVLRVAWVIFDIDNVY
jgi:hypothetical protein